MQTLLEKPAPRPPRQTKTEGGGNPYIYYLRGRVRCPFCNCAYSPGTAGKGPTHYYFCLKDTKRQGKCPVARVNADALHFSVLTLIERAARHHTVMHRLIAESGGWQGAPDDLQRLRGQLAKRRQAIGMQKSNLMRYLEDGRAGDTILNRLDLLENEDHSVAEQLEAVEQDIAAATLVRPTAGQVQASWGAVLDLWPELTEEEKAELLAGLVENVEVKAKDRVVLRLTPIAELHGQLLAINSPMGAGVGFEPTTFGL